MNTLILNTPGDAESSGQLPGGNPRRAPAKRAASKRDSADIIRPASRRDFRLFRLLCVSLLLWLGPWLVSAQSIDVLTQHNDIGRTGAYLAERQLTPATVAGGGMRKLFSLKVQGQVFAQPLYVSGVSRSDGTKRNIVLIATQKNWVYAFDADRGGQLWQQRLSTASNDQPVPTTCSGNSFLLAAPTWGVTSTPVIDRSRNRIYLLAMSILSANPASCSGEYRQTLLSLDVASGNVAGSTMISGSVPSRSGTISFDPRHQVNRAGLLLLGNRIYVAFGGNMEVDPYHGWIFGFDSQSLALKSIYCASPDYIKAGIWQSGNGLMSDGSSIFVETGNGGEIGGAFSPNRLGSSLLKLSVAGDRVTVADFFTPFNQKCLDTCDLDLGAAGPVLLPGQRRIIATGKEGTLYFLDADNLGKQSAGPTDAVIQRFQAGKVDQQLSSPQPGRCDLAPQTATTKACDGNNWRAVAVSFSHIHGSPSVWTSAPGDHLVYLWSEQDHLKAFHVQNGLFVNGGSPVAQSVTVGARSQMPGGVTSISGLGGDVDTAIVWTITPSGLRDSENARTQPWPAGVLRAYRATNLEFLWSSGSLGAGSYAKFAPPTIANGKVYAATFTDEVAVFGLAPVAPLEFQPVNGVLSKLTIGLDGDVWGVNSSQNIFRFDRSSASFLPVPGQLVDISAGGEGQIWGINAKQEIFQFDSGSG